MKDKFTSFSISERVEHIVWNFKQGRFSRNTQIQIAPDLVLIYGTNDMVSYIQRSSNHIQWNGTGFKKL